jgi:hypothetical protein
MKNFELQANTQVTRFHALRNPLIAFKQQPQEQNLKNLGCQIWVPSKTVSDLILIYV